MSTGFALQWPEASRLADRVMTALRPLVVRIEVVGSVRRRRTYVRDIELLLEPRMIEIDLFGTLAPDVAPIRSALEQLGTWVKGGERMIQITDVGHAGMSVDVYLCHPPAQWGSLLAIRTGPTDLGHEAMTRVREKKLRHEYGHLVRGSEVIPTPTEEDFFAAVGLECVPPAERDIYAGQLNQIRERMNSTRGYPARR